MSARQHGATPALASRTREIHHGIRRTERRGVEQRVIGGFITWPAREQVHDTAHRTGAVESGCDPLDHLHLSEVHRRDLEQAQPAHLLAEEWQAVGQEARVSPFHALHAYAGGADRRRRGLYAQPAHLIEHHDDVAGRHQELLFDFLTPDHFDARGLILQSTSCPRAGDNDDVLLNFWLRDQLDFDSCELPLGHLRLGLAFEEPGLRRGNCHRTWCQLQLHDTIRPGLCRD